MAELVGMGRFAYLLAAMPGSRRTGADSLARFAQGLWDFGDLSGFRAGLPRLLRQLIDCGIASYNEIGPDPANVFVAADPVESLRVGDAREAFAVHAMQNPLAAHHARTGDGRVLRLSDFVSMRKLRALDLYDLVYRHIGVDHQLAFTVPSQGQVVGVTVSRDGRDFSAAEQALLEAVRPIVLNAHRNLHDRARLALIVRALDEVEGGPAMVFTVEASGMIAPAHERAEGLLRDLSRGATTEALTSWVEAHRRGELRGRPPPLTLSAGPRRLEAHYLHGAADDLDAIAVRLVAPTREPDFLLELGLTRRQTEVLHLVWQGRGNAEIARELSLSEHTVRHHLEDIYRRLGVSSRTAAAHRANRALATSGLPRP